MGNPEPNNRAAVDFLQWWRPGGPWVLTAIEPDSRGTNTTTFSDKTLEQLIVWLQSLNGKRNIYFHVNQVRGVMTSKAKREDILWMDWLHVDKDPRKGEDLEREQERILALLQAPPGGVPEPSCIVFSGGGYQGFWRLEEPVPINGREDRYEDAKRYNLQLEVLFGADNCHNVDRIMRLPGTINLPDEKKRRRGRHPALAYVVEAHDDRVYPISAFKQAPLVQDDMDGFASGDRVKISGNVERLSSIEELDRLCPDRPNDEDQWNHVKALIVQGEHPIDPGKYPSRSEALFAACCALVRAGASDEVIYSIITDPNFGISSSVLDKGSRTEAYAKRQIEQSREEAIDPWLRKLNSRHAVIANIGGQCRVVEETDTELGRRELTYQSFDNFRNRYMHIRIPVGKDKDGNPVKKQLGRWWLEHEMRRQYDGVVFAPGRHTPGKYNLWKGFSCEARPGDCEPLLEHALNNVCRGNEEHYRYLLGWMASAVQHPDSPGHVAVVMRGDPGTGKSFLAKQFGRLFGRHFLQVSDPKHLVGSFNAHLRDVLVLFGDEAFWAGDKKHESVLKTLVTEETLAIEGKGVDMVTQPNYVHLILASNNNWVVPAGPNERRYFVLDVANDRMQDRPYFRRLAAHMDNGGREALLHYLLTYDLAEFDVRDVPRTQALLDQQLLTMSSEEEWWYGKLVHGQVLNGVAWQQEVLKADVLQDYLDYAQKVGNRRSDATALGKFLKRMCGGGWPKSFQKRVDLKDYSNDRINSSRPYFYKFPALAQARAEWDRQRGGTHEWFEVDEDPEDNNTQENF